MQEKDSVPLKDVGESVFIEDQPEVNVRGERLESIMKELEMEPKLKEQLTTYLIGPSTTSEEKMEVKGMAHDGSDMPSLSGGLRTLDENLVTERNGLYDRLAKVNLLIDKLRSNPGVINEFWQDYENRW